MAKIHNPQDQDGILLINQTAFDGEVSARTEADTLLQSNIDNEVADRQAADSIIQQNIEEEIQNRLTAIESEKTRAEKAETTLQSNIDAEKERAMSAESALTTAVESEKTRAKEAEATLQSIIDAEKERATITESTLSTVIVNEISRAKGAESDLNNKFQTAKEELANTITTLENKLDDHIEALTSADENINTLIADETSRAMAAEEVLSATIEGVDERLLNIEGKAEFITLAQQPINTSQWTAVEFKDNSHWVNQVSNKRIISISFKVANTVSTPHYLAVYDTRTAGTKGLIGISQGTTWEANGDATFTFVEPIIIPGKFEIFLLNEPISGNHTSDPAAPSIFVESFTTEGTQNYRLPSGTWANNAKKAFYITFNFVTDRLGTLEAGVDAHKADTVKHITAEERSAWNAKATVENISALESRINTTVQTLATKAEIANFVTEEVVDQKIATTEHHKPIFDLERNVDKVVFDIATSTEPQTVKLVLSEGKIFAGNVVVSNPVISAALGMINPGGDKMLNVNIGLQETPPGSMNLYVIVDTICDDNICSNAQHVAEVIPVEIIVSETSE